MNNDRKPVVWIVKEQLLRDATGSSAMDYSPAMRYGDLQFITRRDIPMHPGSAVRETWGADVLRFVRDYDQAHDYIIPTGQPVAIFAVGCALGIAGKSPRFLVWRREDNAYRVLEIPANADAPF